MWGPWPLTPIREMAHLNQPAEFLCFHELYHEKAAKSAKQPMTNSLAKNECVIPPAEIQSFDDWHEEEIVGIHVQAKGDSNNICVTVRNGVGEQKQSSGFVIPGSEQKHMSLWRHLSSFLCQ